MKSLDQRAALERIARERHEDYAGLSRLIGRNPAYIQQFIKRGVPRRLAEEDRRTLARYFRIEESELGGPSAGEASGDGPGDLARVPRLDVGAAAGAGSFGNDEPIVSHVSFDRSWLRQLCAARPEDLSIIRVEGDSMLPTLADGDEIMVNAGDAAGRLRDGIYVLRRDDALVVKRLSVNHASGRITVKSDNSTYPPWPDCRPQELQVIGRVVWAGRRVS
jgi:phage repressor protein C with HTH and peptisase S24 domain